MAVRYFRSMRRAYMCRDEHMRGGVRYRWVGLLTVLVLVVAPLQCRGRTRIAFLPFDDRARLNNVPWDLSVDVPSWFSRTVDTIGAKDSLLQSIPFDSVRALIRENRWTLRELAGPLVMQTIASRLDAVYVVSGTVERFKLVKRALNADGALGGTHEASRYATGTGQTPVTIGLQSYTAHVRITAHIYDGRSGNLVQTVLLDVDERDGGLKVWLPVGSQNDELNFYYMSVNPFGSEHFMKTVAAAVMKRCSQLLREAMVGRLAVSVLASPVMARQGFVEGKVLDVSGAEVWVNLGSADNLFLGQRLEVLRPERPVLSQEGDTLGWVEVPTATVKVRSVKSSHFSQATVVEAGTLVQPGWTVRSVLEEGCKP